MQGRAKAKAEAAPEAAAAKAEAYTEGDAQVAEEASNGKKQDLMDNRVKAQTKKVKARKKYHQDLMVPFQLQRRSASPAWSRQKVSAAASACRGSIGIHAIHVGWCACGSGAKKTEKK